MTHPKNTLVIKVLGLTRMNKKGSLYTLTKTFEIGTLKHRKRRGVKFVFVAVDQCPVNTATHCMN